MKYQVLTRPRNGIKEFGGEKWQKSHLGYLTESDAASFAKHIKRKYKGITQVKIVPAESVNNDN